MSGGQEQETAVSDAPVFVWNRKWGRVQVGVTIYRHRGVVPDRWVVHPRFVYDTAPRSRNVLGR